jgi:hypothetical protein
VGDRREEKFPFSGYAIDQKVLETNNGSLQKVLSRLINDTSEVSPRQIVKRRKNMNEHKKSCWDTKKFICSSNDFLQDSIKFQLSTDVK